MAHAATLGGMSYGTESAGAAHAMSQSAGGVHDCPHGALTARVLGPVCEFNAPAAPDRYARIATALGVDTAGCDPLEAAMAGVEEIYRLTDDVDIPSMKELGFSEDEIPMLAQIAFDDPQTIGNPREVDVAGYEEIYRNAFSRWRRAEYKAESEALEVDGQVVTPKASHRHQDYSFVIGGVGRVGVGCAHRGDEPGHGRVARHRSGGDARGRAASDRRRERSVARLGGAVGVRARRARWSASPT